jgi:hypothetical protein
MAEAACPGAESREEQPPYSPPDPDRCPWLSVADALTWIERQTGVSRKDATDALLQAAAAGRVKLEGERGNEYDRFKSANRETIPSDVFRTRLVGLWEIDRDGYPYGRVGRCPGAPLSAIFNEAPNRYAGPYYYDVLVNTADLLREWPAPVPAQAGRPVAPAQVQRWWKQFVETQKATGRKPTNSDILAAFGQAHPEAKPKETSAKRLVGKADG